MEQVLTTEVERILVQLASQFPRPKKFHGYTSVQKVCPEIPANRAIAFIEQLDSLGFLDDVYNNEWRSVSASGVIYVERLVEENRHGLASKIRSALDRNSSIISLLGLIAAVISAVFAFMAIPNVQTH